VDYTTVLNIIFLILAAALCYRFARTGGIPMLKMMAAHPTPKRTSRPYRALRNGGWQVQSVRLGVCEYRL